MSKEQPYNYYNFSSTASHQKTIVVLGCGRGGTSMVAGALRELGVMLGDRFDGVTHEDIEFRTSNVAQLKSLIKSRNATHDVWGWKYPLSIHYLGKIFKDLRNPHFVVVLRNVASVADSFSRYHAQSDFKSDLISINKAYSRIFNFLSKHQSPVMFVNFEKSLSSPQQLIEGLSKFVDIETRSELSREASDFISNDGYSPLTTEQKVKITFSKIAAASDSWVEMSDLKITPVNINSIGKKHFGMINDPQYIIERSKKKKIQSELILKFHFLSKIEDQFKLYFDFGSGFTELSAVLLKEVSVGDNTFKINLPEPCFQMRIDPLDSNDEFTLDRIQCYCAK